MDPLKLRSAEILKKSESMLSWLNNELNEISEEIIRVRRSRSTIKTNISKYHCYYRLNEKLKELNVEFKKVIKIIYKRVPLQDT